MGVTVPSGCGARRWQMCGLCCAAWVVAYSDRTNISLAIVAMEREYGYTAAIDGVRSPPSPFYYNL